LTISDLAKKININCFTPNAHAYFYADCMGVPHGT